MRWPRRRKPDELGALHELIGPLLADATETIPNPNAKETTVTTPAFEPYDELDQEAHNYLTGAPAPTARSLVAILNDDRLRAHRERTDAEIAFAEAKAERKVRSPGWYRRIDCAFATEHFGFPAPGEAAPDGWKWKATDGSQWRLDRDGESWDLTEYMDDDTHLLKAWEKNLLDGARALAAGEPGCHLIETGGTAPRGGHLRLIVDTEHGEYERLEAEWQRREDAQPAEPEVGSVAWLRDLADRLQQYQADRYGPGHHACLSSTPDAIREYADQVEYDERQAAADTRDLERVIALLNTHATYAYNHLDNTVRPGTPFAELPDAIREAAIADALELYRAGREDTVAAWQPGNGGGSGNPGPRGGQPTGQGGAHHA